MARLSPGGGWGGVYSLLFPRQLCFIHLMLCCLSCLSSLFYSQSTAHLSSPLLHYSFAPVIFLTLLLSGPFGHLVLLCASSSGKAKSDPLLTTNKKSDALTGLNSSGSTQPPHLPVPDQVTVFKNFSTLFPLWPGLRINKFSSL